MMDAGSCFNKLVRDQTLKKEKDSSLPKLSITDIKQIKVIFISCSTLIKTSWYKLVSAQGIRKIRIVPEVFKVKLSKTTGLLLAT